MERKWKVGKFLEMVFEQVFVWKVTFYVNTLFKVWTIYIFTNIICSTYLGLPKGEHNLKPQPFLSKKREASSLKKNMLNIFFVLKQIAKNTKEGCCKIKKILWCMFVNVITKLVSIVYQKGIREVVNLSKLE